MIRFRILALLAALAGTAGAAAQDRSAEPADACVRLDKDIGPAFERGLETTLALPGSCTWSLDGGQGKVTVELRIDRLASETEARKLMHFARLEPAEGLPKLGDGGLYRTKDGELFIDAIKDRRHFRFTVRAADMHDRLLRQSLQFAGVTVNGRF